MDRKNFKSKPYHVKYKSSGDVDKTIHTSNTDIGASNVPANLRVYGTAAFDDPAIAINALAFGLRLSVSGSSPVPTANVPSASILYLSPYTSEHVALHDGDHWHMRQTNVVTKSLSTLTSNNTNYDVFVYWNDKIEVVDLSFAAWSSSTARASELERKDGVLVQSGDATKRYAGTIRTVASGVTSDSTSRRYVWNFYNRVARSFYATMTTVSWTYSSTTWRFAGTGATSVGSNAAGIVCGDVTAINASVHDICSCTTDSHMEVGVGLDNTTNLASGAGFVTGGTFGSITCRWDGQVTTPGFRLVCWLEHGESATGTFYGNSSVRSVGLQGVIWG